MSSLLKKLSVSIKIHVVKQTQTPTTQSVWPVSKLSIESVGSRRELVANYRRRWRDATRQNSFVSSASAVCIGHIGHALETKVLCVLWTGLLLPPPKTEVMCSLRAVCRSVCSSDNSKSCERILTKFLGGEKHFPGTKWLNFGDDPDHRPDPGVRSPKSGFTGLSKKK